MTESFQPEEAFAAANQATERASQQVREFGERTVATSRDIGNAALDSYERALATFLELEHRAAEAAPVDWAKTAIEAHASFVKDINDAYLKAVRGVLV